MKNDSLIYFALKFALIAAILLLVFHFVFPYYRILVNKALGIFVDVTNIQSTKRTFLVFMPYVSLFALILATPKVSAKYKSLSLLLVFVLFFIIDISFSIVQILLQNTSITSDDILIVQDLFAIAAPVVLWLLLFNRSFQFL